MQQIFFFRILTINFLFSRKKATVREGLLHEVEKEGRKKEGKEN